MAKPAMEKQSVDHIPWRRVEGGGISGAGIYEKILSMDPETGSYTRLVRVEAGVETQETMSHDVWEEVYVLEGRYTDRGKNKVITKGMYACLPPGMKHGPYTFHETSLLLEMTYRQLT